MPKRTCKMDVDRMNTAIVRINSRLAQHCRDLAFDMEVAGELTRKEAEYVATLYIEIEIEDEWVEAPKGDE
jgi:hypothetical protein